MNDKLPFNGKISLILGNMFSGKCLGIDTPILMYDGTLKMVQDIKIGDYIMGDDSTYREVLTICQGTGKLFKVIPFFGDSYIVNEDHILSLKHSRRNKKIKNISIKDYLKKSINFKKTYKGYRVSINFNTKLIDLDPYIIGLWLGDSINNDLKIFNKDKEIIKIYENHFLKNNFKKELFHNKLKELNLFKNKHIPNSFKTNNREQRLKLLAGLLETDGYYNKSQQIYKIFQINKKLSEDILYLVRSLGFSALIKEMKKINIIYITGNHLDEIPCKILRKKAKKFTKKDDNLLVSIKVDYIGLGNYYGFTIGGNNLFVLGDFTVTHNTSELIRRYKRYSIAGKKCLMIKYKNDTRYDKKMIVTHDNLKVEAFVCEFLYEADSFINDFDVICVDEVQFYKDAHIFCDKWANKGKIIEACGLNGTFNRTGFEIVNKLIPLADDIVHLKAICKETGQDAVYTKLNIEHEGNNFELIGGNEKYSAVDRKTFFDNDTIIINDDIQKIKEFFKIYLISKKISVIGDIDNLIDNFLNENLNEFKNNNFWINYENIINLFLVYISSSK